MAHAIQVVSELIFGHQFSIECRPGYRMTQVKSVTRPATRIIMGTRGMDAIKGLILASLTYGVVHLAETPVTLVKYPNHFISPQGHIEYGEGQSWNGGAETAAELA